jgi:hypothetical protein
MCLLITVAVARVRELPKASLEVMAVGIVAGVVLASKLRRSVAFDEMGVSSER